MVNSKRRIKKIKNKTIKKGGTTTESIKSIDPPREGLIDMIGDKLSSVATSAVTKIADTGLNIAGLERVDKNNNEGDTTKNVDENIEKIGNAASGIVTDVKNVADKTGSAIIQNVNEVLGSNTVKETTAQAAEDTANIIKESAEKFNDALNNPVVKTQVKEAIENASELGTVFVKAAEKPVNEAIQHTAESLNQALPKLGSAATKTFTDSLLVTPLGPIIEVGNIINDVTKATSAAVEAGTDAIEVASDAFIETKKNVEEGLKDLQEKKKMVDQISNRTTKSINQFENPISQTQNGGRKTSTRRKHIKRKGKSKRVRFAM